MNNILCWTAIFFGSLAISAGVVGFICYIYKGNLEERITEIRGLPRATIDVVRASIIKLEVIISLLRTAGLTWFAIAAIATITFLYTR